VVGDPGVDVGGPVTAGPEGQPGGGVGAGLLGQQPLVLGLVGDLGGQVCEHPTAEHAQLAGPEGLGLLDQVGLRLDPQVVTEIRGSASRASTITRACARFNVPAARVSPTSRHRVSRASASAAARRTELWASRVWSANHAAADRAPVTSAMSPDAASTRIRSASARAMTRDSRTSAPCFSSVLR
jgi:hypothetical protein